MQFEFQNNENINVDLFNTNARLYYSEKKYINFDCEGVTKKNH